MSQTNNERAQTIVDFCRIEEQYKDSVRHFVAWHLDEACMQARKAGIEELRLQLMTQTLIVRAQHRV